MADIFGSKEVYIFVQDDETAPSDIVKIKLHATTGYSISRSAVVSNQPVSDGSDRSDHYSNNSKTIRLSGVIADHINPFRVDRTEKTSQEYVKTIDTIMDNKQVITAILPELGYVKNCMITSFNPSRGTQTGLGTSVSLTLQTILIASVGTTTYVKAASQDTLSEEESNGSVDTEAADLEQHKVLEDLILGEELEELYLMNYLEDARQTTLINSFNV